MGLFTFFFICAVVLLAQCLTKEDAKMGGLFLLALAMIDLVFSIEDWRLTMTEILADIQKLYAEGYSVDSIALLCDAPVSFVVEAIAQEECYDL